MEWILLPEWTVAMIALHATLALYAVSIGWLVNSGLLKLNYSKFRKSDGISSRTGMLILYFVPIIALVPVVYPYLSSTGTAIQWILTIAIVVHFTKRCLEVLFVHKYSGPIDILTVVQITGMYCLIAVLSGIFHERTIANIDIVFVVGVVLFVLGQLGNLYHHWLLAQLRKSQQGYVIPNGGLFSHVGSPHYLFEIVAWLGFTLMSRHLVMLIGWGIMTHYLINRGDKSHQWYLEKFPDYPPNRKRIIPFLY